MIQLRAADRGVEGPHPLLRRAKHLEVVSWLKTQHGMSHGHANALVAHTLAEDRDAQQQDG